MASRAFRPVVRTAERAQKRLQTASWQCRPTAHQSFRASSADLVNESGPSVTDFVTVALRSEGAHGRYSPYSPAVRDVLGRYHAPSPASMGLVHRRYSSTQAYSAGAPGSTLEAPFVAVAGIIGVFGAVAAYSYSQFSQTKTKEAEKTAEHCEEAASRDSVAAPTDASAKPVSPRAVVICGPSGVGKGTLINKLMAEQPDLFGFSVSHTTRQPRKGEENGVHYHFAEKEAMQAEIDAGGFLESANVHGNLYGTSRAAVETVGKSGKICILDIDVQGARQVKDSGFPIISIFINPPSFEELERRLRGRGTESEQQIEKRLSAARKEMAESVWFDHVIVNEDLEAASAKLKELVLPVGATDQK
eukprot:TRINITY_DN29633_c0_g1_i1.p1 TRINITY_DN29633_c0_g1~~TRINITY_DN29633_c0_g1_i1.p1  ORF type:complete len:361 (+),score=65.05 TRINITY_DN29633_c0_g1_i1:338-1420(+)